VSSFWPTYLTPFDYTYRRQLTQQMIDKGEMDKKYEMVTLSMDGTHRLIEQSEKHPTSNLQSYKLKDCAYIF
jgi:hypothetical protein